ncbi:hypothetical protein F7725_022941 [Dissostichus mawsoni]|uniref:Kinesin-like protein Kif23 Arf6-interacting domain-containing protein n=1 Tax=Dissostichus mawsoni TaxID=36200 RepID=A0A7J5YZN8_DISMA|nr:hypothetical protein F7725_022941 [Dissostichus mawsoni]
MASFQIDILQKTTKIYEGDKRSLQTELETREQRLQREQSEKKRMEQRLNGVDRRVNAMQLEMQNKLWVKDEKLKQLKAIVTDSKTSGRPDPPPRQTQPQRPSREELPQRPSREDRLQIPSREERFQRPSREERLPAKRSASPSPVPYSHVATQSPVESPYVRTDPEPVSATRVEEVEMNPRPSCPVPSSSASLSKWVDHKPSSSVDLGTVLQPVIPNAIQVSTPSEKALSKCDRYVLTHQEVASDGEIQTQLIKGEVIKTRGGGQSVQFTDIETLRQELTTVPRLKRKSSEGAPASGERTDGSWTDVETRAQKTLTQLPPAIPPLTWLLCNSLNFLYSALVMIFKHFPCFLYIYIRVTKVVLYK